MAAKAATALPWQEAQSIVKGFSNRPTYGIPTCPRGGSSTNTRAKDFGTENYSRVFDALMKRGWAGFEEAFDRIAPRDREDYAAIKRDLLREPVFNMQAHRHMADVVLGRKTVDEVFDEMARQHEQRKPQ